MVPLGKPMHDALIGEDRVEAIGSGLEQRRSRSSQGDPPCQLCRPIGLRQIAGAVDAEQHVKLAFRCLHLGDIHVEEADRISLEALPFRLTPSASSRRDMPWRYRQRCCAERVRAGWLGVEAIIPRKQIEAQGRPISTSTSSWTLTRPTRPHWSEHGSQTPASWINQFERWLAEVTRDQLRCGVHTSTNALKQDTPTFIKRHTRTNSHTAGPRPQTWSSHP